MISRYGFVDRQTLERRAEQLRRFEEWQRAHPHRVDARQALAGIGFLYELLPLAARKRPFDPSGVQAMQRALALLERRPR